MAPASLVALLGACATAGSPSSDAQVDPPALDAGVDAGDAMPPGVDAMVEHDAGPVPVELTQNSSATIDSNASIRCGAGDAHAENRYFRAFDLAAMGVEGELTVDTATFAVQTAVGDGGVQPVNVILHTLSGEFTLANLTQIASAVSMVSDTTLSLETVSITATVPAGSTLVMEIHTADNDSNNFWLGANDDGQDAEPLIVWAPCSYVDPTPVSEVEIMGVDTSLVHYVMGVSGTAQP